MKLIKCKNTLSQLKLKIAAQDTFLFSPFPLVNTARAQVVRGVKTMGKTSTKPEVKRLLRATLLRDDLRCQPISQWHGR